MKDVGVFVGCVVLMVCFVDFFATYTCIYKFSLDFCLGVGRSIQRSKKGTNLAVNSGCFMLFHFSESRLYMADTLERFRYSPASPS